MMLLFLCRNEFVIFSSSGNFQVQEGDVLAGSLYECHRDPELFDDPEMFMPSRFTDEVCLAVLHAFNQVDAFNSILV